MASQTPTKIWEIAPIIKAKIETDLGLGTEAVRWIYRRALPAKSIADVEVFLRFRRLSSLFWQGGGAYNAVSVRHLDVAIRSRMNTDTYTDESWAFDPNIGFFILEEKLLRSMLWNSSDGTEFIPTDSDGNTLTVEPLKMLSADDAMKIPDAPGWGEATYTFQVIYQHDLGALDS